MSLGRVPLKYRHVYGEPLKKEFWYENIPISRNAHDGSFISCNPKFLAVSAESSGGGAFLVLNKLQTGRMSGMNLPRVCGHKAAVLDLQWNPFDDHIIASSSEDCTVKLWQIPEDGVNGDLTESLVDLEGHHRRVLYSKWHPSAANILASAAYDHKVLVWDVEQQSIFCNIGCHKDQIMSIAWSTDGRLLSTSSKDKQLRILDPRSGTEVLKVKAHFGPKAQKSLWLDDDMIVSVGFGQCGEREYAVWHMNNFKTELQRVDIDQSSSTLIPFYDYDTKMLYFVGKGDGNIRYYEFSQNEVHYLNQYTSNIPQRGVGMMPKRDMDQARCEVTRLYKLHVTNPIVEPIAMIAPRRGAYVDDLYPPTNATVPAVSGKDWMAGNNRKPVLVDLLTGNFINPPPPVPTVQLARQTAAKTPASIANISHLTSAPAAPFEARNSTSPHNSPSPETSVLRSPVKKTNGYVRPKSSYELDYSEDQLGSTTPPNRAPPRSNSGERMENDEEEKEEEVFDKGKFKKMFALFENNAEETGSNPSFNRFSRKTQSMREPRRNTTSLAETQARILGLQEQRRNSEVSSQDEDSSSGGGKARPTNRPESYQAPEDRENSSYLSQQRDSNHFDNSNMKENVCSSTPANQDTDVMNDMSLSNNSSPDNENQNTPPVESNFYSQLKNYIELDPSKNASPNSSRLLKINIDHFKMSRASSEDFSPDSESSSPPSKQISLDVDSEAAQPPPSLILTNNDNDTSPMGLDLPATQETVPSANKSRVNSIKRTPRHVKAAMKESLSKNRNSKEITDDDIKSIRKRHDSGSSVKDLVKVAESSIQRSNSFRTEKSINNSHCPSDLPKRSGSVRKLIFKAETQKTRPESSDSDENRPPPPIIDNLPRSTASLPSKFRLPPQSKILPSVPEFHSTPVSKNFDSHELRKKCEEQQTEIDNLKKQLYLKNQRILQLEDKLDELLAASGAVDTMKARQFVEGDESRC